MTLARIPEILRRLEEHLGVPAFLAGGACRDDYNQRPIKDYDIFVPDHVLNQAEPTAIAAALGAPWKFTQAFPTDYFQGNMAKQVGPIFVFENGGNAVFDNTFCLPDGPPIQLIGLKVPSEAEWNIHHVLNRIDIGLCRTGLKANGSWVFAPEFTSDVVSRTITIVDKRDVDRSLIRARRIQEKYPEFKIAL